MINLFTFWSFSILWKQFIIFLLFFVHKRTKSKLFKICKKWTKKLENHSINKYSFQNKYKYKIKMKLIQFWYFDWKLIYIIYSSYLGHLNYQWTSNCFMNCLPIKMNENKIIEILLIVWKFILKLKYWLMNKVIFIDNWIEIFKLLKIILFLFTKRWLWI